MNVIKVDNVIDNDSKIIQETSELTDIFGDDDLIKKLFPQNNTKIIFSEDFMKKSKDFYSELPRLGRELIQNFIDANPEDPGTLNGVDIQHKSNKEGNTITIRGNRPFENPTALYKLDSGKVDDKNKAGGNGIGLKQTVLVLFRDYNIQEFIIKGESWDLQYKFLSKDEINDNLKKKGIPGEVKKGRLVANVSPVEKRDFTEYEIKTQGGENDKVFKGLQNIKNYGIYKEHPAIQNPDFEISKIGGFKFLEDKQQIGEFFLNGQKFRCEGDYIQKKDTTESYTEKEYRGGPTGINLWITGDYEMSIDRQPIGSVNIGYYLDELVFLMSRKELMHCLLKTSKVRLHLIIRKYKTLERKPRIYEYCSRSSDTPILEHFIYNIVSRLGKKEFNIRNLATLVGISSEHEQALVACDIENTNQLESLSKKGYILVPEYFSKIGIPPASLLIQEQESEINSKEIQEANEQQAMTMGVAVPYREFGKNGLKNERLYYGHLVEGIDKNLISYNNETQTLLIQDRFNHCSRKDLYSVKTTEKINDIRGLFVLGKKKEFFDSFILYACRKKVEFSFNEEDEELFVKLSETDKNYQYNSIEIQSSEFSRENIEERTKKLSKKDFKEAKSSGVSKGLMRSPLGKFAKGITVAMTIAFLFFGAKYVVKNFSRLTNASYIEGKDISFKDMIDGGFNEVKHLFSSSKDVADFINKYNQADIKMGTKNMKISELENIIAKQRQKMSPEEELLATLQRDPVEDFKILDNISETQKKQLELLKTYVEVSLGMDIDNKLFLFDGKGAKGINIGRIKIGFHKSMMNVDFFEALKTFIHEIAHNYIMDHSTDFIGANSALLIAITERYDNLMDEMIYNKDKSKNLSDEEKFILTANQYRNSLK